MDPGPLRIAITFRRVDPTRGGAETYIADLLKALTARGHDVALFASEWDEQAVPAGVATTRIPIRGRSRIARVRHFADDSAALLEARADGRVVIGAINTWYQDILIPQGGVHPASVDHNARRHPAGWRRAFYTWSKRLNPGWGAYREIERLQYDPARPTRYVAVSAFVRSHLMHYYGVPAGRIDVIHNAIDAGRLAIDDPRGARPLVRERHGLAPGDLVGLFVGHNFWLKGLAPLLEALAVRASLPRPIRLLVCGGGRLAPFRKMVDRLGVGDDVRLVGFADDIRPYYHASDFFVSPTYYDPCSLVVFEALACGLPVITTACNGAGEVIAPGREGFVIREPDDRTGLIAALDAMTDDGRRGEMAALARATGRSQTFGRHLDRLEAVVRRVVAERASTPHSSSRSRRMEGTPSS